MTHSPIKRSSVHHVQAHHHVQFASRQGWEIATAYGDVTLEKAAAQNGVALADVSWFGKLECKGDWVGALEGQPIEGAVFYKLIPSHAIWIIQPDRVDAVCNQLETIRTGKARSYLINTGSCYASFEVLGPKAADVFYKLSSLTVAAGGHTQGTIAGVHCLVIQSEKGYQIHFGREFGEYMWECFLDAGAEFGIRPAGLDAIV